MDLRDESPLKPFSPNRLGRRAGTLRVGASASAVITWLIDFRTGLGTTFVLEMGG